MAVDSKHPLFIDRRPDWDVMDDTFAGERRVKERGEVYLPPTSSMTAAGLGQRNSPGQQAYDAYRARAVFHDVVKEAVRGLVGAMWHKPPVIELPAALEPMRERATIRKESLEQLLRRINEAQLKTGRFGMMLDLPTQEIRAPNVLPYIATYEATEIINWDEGTRDDAALVNNLNLVTLDESEFERQTDFDWEFEEKYRVLILGDPLANEAEGGGVYRVAVFRNRESTFAESRLFTPILRGQALTQIPFVFVNAQDIVADPSDPPLLGLAKLALAIYRGEADYRQSLFLQGQDTFVTTGSMIGQNSPAADGQAAGQGPVRTGAGAHVQMELGGDAKFIGVESSGLAEQREALQNDRGEAALKGGQLLDSNSRQAEAAEALRIRVSASTATLNEIALTGAGALQELLRICAEWVGADPAEVNITPNQDFSAEEFFSKQLVELMTARGLEAPLSLRSIHELQQKRDLTSRTFEEELAQIALEQSGDLEGATRVSGTTSTEVVTRESAEPTVAAPTGEPTTLEGEPGAEPEA